MSRIAVTVIGTHLVMDYGTNERAVAAMEALRSEPTLDATHDIRGHYPYHEYPHPDDHVHPTEPTLDEGLREAIGLVLRMEDEGRLEDRSGTVALDDLRAALRDEGETT